MVGDVVGVGVEVGDDVGVLVAVAAGCVTGANPLDWDVGVAVGVFFAGVFEALAVAVGVAGGFVVSPARDAVGLTLGVPCELGQEQDRHHRDDDRRGGRRDRPAPPPPARRPLAGRHAAGAAGMPPVPPGTGGGRVERARRGNQGRRGQLGTEAALDPRGGDRVPRPTPG